MAKMEHIPEMDHIHSKDWWNGIALVGPENIILSGYSTEQFWNEEVKIEGLNKDIIFLDLGCGIGRVAKWVKDSVKEYCGVDFSKEMIKKAKKRFKDFKDFKNVNFFVNNGKDLKLFEDNKFDFVYVHLLFQHLTKKNTLNYIKEVHRVLKKGGIFLANHIPVIRYEGGLTEEEVDEAMKPFKILNKELNEFYFHIKCQK